MVNRTVEQNVQGVLALGSERQKLAYMARQQPSLDASVDLCMESARTDSEVGKMALEAVLQRKGRVLAAYAASLARVRNRSTEADATLWKKFVDHQRVLSAKLTTDAPSQRDVVYEDLLARIGAADAAFEDVTQSATVEKVRAALPERSVLVEFVAYRPQREVANSSIRYAAFALSPNGSLSFAPLGDEGPLLRRVNDLRAALTNPESSNVATLGRELFDAVLAPIAASLSDVDRLFVSTDGVLNLVPFAALVDASGQYSRLRPVWERQSARLRRRASRQGDRRGRHTVV